MRKNQGRELTYSSLSLISSFIVYYSYKDDLVQGITMQGSLPSSLLLFIVGSELLKLSLSLLIFPDGGGSGGSAGGNSRGRPYFREPQPNGSNKSSIRSKIRVSFKLFAQLLLAVASCALLNILFGAPLFRDILLTLQFSLIQTAWICGPLLLSLPAASFLREIIFVSEWDTSVGRLRRGKIRLFLGVGGTLLGAAFFPLDWDRPWQKWPIPCLFTLFSTFVLVNFGIVSYILYYYTTLFHKMAKNDLFESKAKNF